MCLGNVHVMLNPVILRFRLEWELGRFGDTILYSARVKGVG